MIAPNLLDNLLDLETLTDVPETPLVSREDAAAAVQRCLTLPPRLGRLTREAFRRAPFAPDPASVRLNARLRFIFAKEAVRQVLSVAEVLAAEGMHLPDAERLPELLRQLEMQERDAFQYWELPSNEGAEEALAASARGELPEITDAFAEIAGISREQLLERIEAHKRSRGK